jgi:hypothetical protein
MNKKFSLVPAAIAFGLYLFSTQAGAATVFDFEDQTSGSYSSITSTVGGITTSIYRANGNPLTVLGIGPPAWQSHSLIGTDFPDVVPPAGIIANFSTALTSASIQFGDFGGDDDTVWLEAWSGLNGTGTLLGSSNLFYPASRDISNGDIDIGSLTVFGTGIQSLRFYSTGDANYTPDSVYWDNLSVTVPEPGTLSLLTMGIFSLMFGKRRDLKTA